MRAGRRDGRGVVRCAAIGAIVACLVCATSVLAETYYSRDADGTYHFTNVPRSDAQPFVAGTALAARLRSELRAYEQASARDPEYQSLIAEASARYGVEPELVRAVIRAESAFNPLAVSSKGARGLMQLMPGTARSRGCLNPHDARANIEAGVEHLRSLLDEHKKNLPRALAAYNAGSGPVGRYHGIPPYAETQQYVTRVLRFRREYLRSERLTSTKPR